MIKSPNEIIFHACVLMVLGRTRNQGGGPIQSKRYIFLQMDKQKLEGGLLCHCYGDNLYMWCDSICDSISHVTALDAVVKSPLLRTFYLARKTSENIRNLWKQGKIT